MSCKRAVVHSSMRVDTNACCHVSKMHCKMDTKKLEKEANRNAIIHAVLMP